MPTVLTLPWRWTSQTRPERVLLFASRFDASGLRGRWRLLVGGMRLRNAVLSSRDALGVSLRTQPFAGRFYTLSMWRDESSLLAFAHDEAHRSAVRSVSRLGTVSGVLVSREAEPVKPCWREVVAWVDDAEPGSYHRVDASARRTGSA
jgi:hypothetical protein